MAGIGVTGLADTFGAELSGVNLADLMDENLFAGVEAAFHHYGLIAIRGQKIDHQTHLAVSALFGEMDVHPQPQFTVPEANEIYVFGNTRAEGNATGGRYWHSDQSYLTNPCRIGLMYAAEVPEEGGDTLFADMYAAFKALDDETKKRIQGLTATHLWHKMKSPERIAELDDEQKSKLKGAVHPVVRVHPSSGRKALFVNEGFTARINELAEDEGNALLDRLCKHCMAPQFQYRHQWQVGDFVIWDHRCLIHSATYYNPQQRRTLYRTSIKGEPCIAVDQWPGSQRKTA
jgi:taurine dioxygenase